ncbi:MAG: hypothetical protein QXU65_05345 [Sulfolobales archaeon]
MIEGDESFALAIPWLDPALLTRGCSVEWSGVSSAREEATKLLRALVSDYSSFFDSRGYLNSEGRKVFERAVRSLVSEEKWLKKSVARVRKRGSFEDVVKLLELLTGTG